MDAFLFFTSEMERHNRRFEAKDMEFKPLEVLFHFRKKTGSLLSDSASNMSYY